MFRSANAVLLFAILSVPLAQVNDKHAARFECLVVTARAIESDESTFYKEGTHFVTVYVTMKNLGEFAVCAAPVLVMLETTDGLQYGQTMLLIGPSKPFPKEPRTWAMLPGEETSGGYIFEVRDGAEPLELSLRLLPGMRCGLDRKTRAYAIRPKEVRLSVRDLPAPRQHDEAKIPRLSQVSGSNHTCGD